MQFFFDDIGRIDDLLDIFGTFEVIEEIFSLFLAFQIDDEDCVDSFQRARHMRIGVIGLPLCEKSRNDTKKLCCKDYHFCLLFILFDCRH